MIKTNKLFGIAIVCLLISQFALAQGFDVPKGYDFKTKEDYGRYESDINEIL
jgi:hypothetical protein